MAKKGRSGFSRIQMLKTQPFLDSATDAPGLDSMLFREGMSRVAAAVHVVATDGPAGRAGFTATAVTPVTDSPPSLLVCVNAASRSVAALLENRVFCVNALAEDDIPVADAFAGRTPLQGPARFAVGEWTRSLTGSPLLASSLVSFDCRLTEARIIATHHVIIAKIIEIRLGALRPALVYQGRGYRAL
jgi:flavin reductase